MRKSEKCDKFEIESEHDIECVKKWEINKRWERNHDSESHLRHILHPILVSTL